jgi:hypothetical protein
MDRPQGCKVTSEGKVNIADKYRCLVVGFDLV